MVWFSGSLVGKGLEVRDFGSRVGYHFLGN